MWLEESGNAVNRKPPEMKVKKKFFKACVIALLHHCIFTHQACIARRNGDEKSNIKCLIYVLPMKDTCP